MMKDELTKRLFDSCVSGDFYDVQETLAKTIKDPEFDFNQLIEIEGEQYTPLMLGTYYQHYEIVEMLLEIPNVDPNAKCANGQSPLLIGIDLDDVKMVKLLLGNKTVDPNYHSDKYSSPLHVAVKNNSNVEIIKMLLDDVRTNVDHRNKQGETVFENAYRFKMKQEIELLLSYERVRNAIDVEKMKKPIRTLIEENQKLLSKTNDRNLVKEISDKIASQYIQMIDMDELLSK